MTRDGDKRQMDTWVHLAQARQSHLGERTIVRLGFLRVSQKAHFALVASLLLVAMPGAPSRVLAPSSEHNSEVDPSSYFVASHMMITDLAFTGLCRHRSRHHARMGWCNRGSLSDSVA